MNLYKFQLHWLKRTDNLGYEIGLWCIKCITKENNAFCTICQKSFSHSNKGIQDILQHSSTVVHMKNASDKLDSNQLKIQTTSSSKSSETSALPVRDLCLKAEIIWVIKNVHCNMSANSCDDLGQTFQTMFPDSEIVKKFSLGPTKFQYLLTEGMAPYYQNKLIEDVKKSHGFVLSYDETTNAESKKELQVRVRYYSEDDQQVNDRHLRTYFLGSATAKIISDFLMDASQKLPIERLLMLGSDGPNVNKAVLDNVNKEISCVRPQGLLNFGPCNLHVANNAFTKSISEYGKDASDLAIAVYYFFHNEPVRCQDYENIQEQNNVPKHRFIKHSTTRWLTLRNSVLILNEQWTALKKYFLNFLPLKSGVKQTLFTSVKYTTICDFLKQEDMPAQLKFVASSAELFENFSQQFQKEEPLIHVLYESIETLILKFASRICTNESLMQFKNNKLKSGELFKQENFLSLQSIILDEDVKKNLEKVGRKENLIVLNKIREHYKCACLHLLKKSSLEAYPHSSILYACRCLQPKRIQSKYSTNYICKIADYLSVQGVNSSTLADEWNLLKFESLPELNKSERIDHYWQKNIFNIKDCNNDFKYPSISQVVKVCLSLAHGNSDVERGFSKSKLTLTKDKAKMSERTLNARMITHDSTKDFKNKLHQIPITEALLSKARDARKCYMEILENERKAAEKTIEAKKKEKRRIEEEKENLKKIEAINRNVKTLESNLEDLKKQTELTKKSSDTLMRKAKAQLDAALTKNDLEGVHIARGMMTAVETMRKEERIKEEEISKLNTEIELKKNKVLNKLLEKKN